VRAGDDNLARQALARKQEHETIATQFQQQWISQKQAVEKLKDALRLLNNKIEEAKRKKNILIARKKRAEAQQQIANTMQGLGDTSAFDTFDRMAERIQIMEAEAEAGAELAGELSGDTLESKFLQLEQGGGGTEDDALSELKAKMGVLEAPKGDSAKQLSAGAGGKDDHKGDSKGTSTPSAGSSLTARTSRSSRTSTCPSSTRSRSSRRRPKPARRATGLPLRLTGAHLGVVPHSHRRWIAWRIHDIAEDRSLHASRHAFLSAVLFVALTGSVVLADDAKPADPKPEVTKRKVPLRVVKMLPETHQVLLLDKIKGSHVVAEVGQNIDGYIVDEIDDDEVTLVSETGSEVILTAPDQTWRRRAAERKAAAGKTVPAATAKTDRRPRTPTPTRSMQVRRPRASSLRRARRTMVPTRRTRP